MQNASRVRMLLKDMVGPWGLEPQTSTVSSKDRYYNNLQDRGDCQSTRKSYKTYFLWVGLWVEIFMAEAPIYTSLPRNLPLGQSFQASPRQPLSSIHAGISSSPV